MGSLASRSMSRAPRFCRHKVDEAEVARVYEGTEAYDWTVQPNFGASAYTDRHVVLDRHSGEVRFGPRIRESDGIIISMACAAAWQQDPVAALSHRRR